MTIMLRVVHSLSLDHIESDDAKTLRRKHLTLYFPPIKVLDSFEMFS